MNIDNLDLNFLIEAPVPPQDVGPGSFDPKGLPFILPKWLDPAGQGGQGGQGRPPWLPKPGTYNPIPNAPERPGPSWGVGPNDFGPGEQNQGPHEDGPGDIPADWPPGKGGQNMGPFQEFQIPTWDGIVPLYISPTGQWFDEFGMPVNPRPGRAWWYDPSRPTPRSDPDDYVPWTP